MPDQPKKLLYRRRRPRERYIEEKIFFDITDEFPQKTPSKTITAGLKKDSASKAHSAGRKPSQDVKTVPSPPPQTAERGKFRSRRAFRFYYALMIIMILAALGGGWHIGKQRGFRLTLPFGWHSHEEISQPSVSPEGTIIYPLKPFIVPLNSGGGQLALVFLEICISSKAKNLLESNLPAVRKAIFKTIWNHRSSDLASDLTLKEAMHIINDQFQSTAVVKLSCKKITTI